MASVTQSSPKWAYVSDGHEYMIVNDFVKYQCEMDVCSSAIN